MNIDGTRIKKIRLIETNHYIIILNVEMVVPIDDPSEPCYEPAVVNFLQEVHEHIDKNDIPWLEQHGKVLIKRHLL
jgi:hypothetical protein